MPDVRLSKKQHSTLLHRSRANTSASVSATGAKSTATTSLKPSGMQPGSALEEHLMFQVMASRIQGPVREFKFHPSRRWRSDFAWPDCKLLVEVEGGHWSGGRHTRGSGFDGDCEKYNEAALLGWRVLRVTSTHIKSGEALDWIRRALA
jgi:very-short-patch-repair endonuclease